MTYQETIRYLFESTPVFQQVGAEAYKEGLSNTRELDAHFGHPHRAYKTIHVGGTNGKGTTAHTLAAILQSAGYRVGLYTSPHLVDFRERIRVNGEMIPEQYVVDFVEQERSFFEPLQPSFFELTTALAFKYFKEQHVDVAVIEVGLGGRLDCTNIITPELAVITNISLDHIQFLGDTVEKIAAEKAGIIKTGVPVVIGEALPETRPVFERRAAEVGAKLYFAEDCSLVLSSTMTEDGYRLYETDIYGQLVGELTGDYQIKNANTILSALQHMNFRIPEEAVRKGFAEVCELTGLKGRWQVMRENPAVVCDTGHNLGGWKYLAERLQKEKRALYLVFGMMADKDVDSVLDLLPRRAHYYFAEAGVKRALSSETLLQKATERGLRGKAFHSVAAAYAAAFAAAAPADFIYVGGSSFIVADFLTHCNGDNLA